MVDSIVFRRRSCAKSESKRAQKRVRNPTEESIISALFVDSNVPHKSNDEKSTNSSGTHDRSRS